jgi:hypothetical protein
MGGTVIEQEFRLRKLPMKVGFVGDAVLWKTREWAQQYVTELSEFNLEGGLFFSQDLYVKFFDLRSQLYEAIKETEPNGTVNPSRTKAIREVVYGTEGDPGLSTHLKDDLGSYGSVTLQRRLSAL